MNLVKPFIFCKTYLLYARDVLLSLGSPSQLSFVTPFPDVIHRPSCDLREYRNKREIIAFFILQRPLNLEAKKRGYTQPPLVFENNHLPEGTKRDVRTDIIILLKEESQSGFDSVIRRGVRISVYRSY